MFDFRDDDLGGLENAFTFKPNNSNFSETSIYLHWVKGWQHWLGRQTIIGPDCNKQTDNLVIVF